ncbi:MAG: O-antigen ligase family protein [Desulfobacteraceae bacterium]|nr:O-antigen ligase family protein [Desulfobacteraceae bacterium]
MNSDFEKHNRTGDRIVFAGLIFLLIFAPFAFGSVHLWAYTLVETGVFFLLILFFINRLVFSGNHILTWVKTPVNLILICFVLLIILQLLPLPSSLVRIISPRTFADKIQLLEIINTGEAPAKGIQWMCLAYYMHPVILELLKLTAYLGMFFLVLNTAKSKKRINILIYLLLLLGLFQSAYALGFQFLTDDPVVWWWRRAWRGIIEKHFFQSVSGTFIGSNHFAFYMEMVILLCTGFIISHMKRDKRFISKQRGFRSYTRHILNWFAPDSPVPKMFFLLLCTMFMGGVFLLSRSRSGIISMATAMFLVSGIFIFKKEYRRYRIMVISLFVVMSGFGVFFGISPVLEKFSQSGKGLYMRLYTTKTMVPMLPDYPLVGVGLGNLYHMYPRYIPKDVPKDFEGVSTSGHSHNDWLEAGTETGFPGLILIFSAYIVFLVKITRTWLGRKDFYALGIGAGVTALLISTGIHSFFDLSMHIPANPLTLSAVLGLGYAAVHRQGKEYSESFSYETGEIRLTFLRRVIIVSAAGFIFLTAIVAAGRHFMAEINCSTKYNPTLKLANMNPGFDEIQKAISFNPLNAEYTSRMAGYYAWGKGRDRNFKKGVRNESIEKAVAIMKKAVSLNPADAEKWYTLGKICAIKHRYATGESLEQALYIADQSYDAGMRCSPTDADTMFEAAIYWVQRSKFIPLNDDSQNEEGIQKFQETFQRVLYLKPDLWEGSAYIIRRYYPDAAVVSGIVPPGDEKLKLLVTEWIAKRTGAK